MLNNQTNRTICKSFWNRNDHCNSRIDFQRFCISNRNCIDCFSIFCFQNNLCGGIVCNVSRGCYCTIHRLNINRNRLLLICCTYTDNLHIQIGLNNDMRIISTYCSIADCFIQLGNNRCIRCYRIIISH